jgi:hypothetical protein
MRDAAARKRVQKYKQTSREPMWRETALEQRRPMLDAEQRMVPMMRNKSAVCERS